MNSNARAPIKEDISFKINQGKQQPESSTLLVNIASECAVRTQKVCTQQNMCVHNQCSVVQG